MEQRYDKKKEQLMSNLSDMSEIAEEMLQNAIKALEKKDVVLAKEVINRDDVLDTFLISIEEQVSRLITISQPLASSAWFNIAVIKIATSLERIGDLANNIAETVLELKNEKYLEPLVMIPELADTVSEMLDAVLEAFITNNVDLAEAVCRKDEVADNIYEQIYERGLKLINQSEGTRNINQVIRFINVAKALERVGDHATNIGEDVIFISTGKRVKY